PCRVAPTAACASGTWRPAISCACLKIRRIVLGGLSTPPTAGTPSPPGPTASSATGWWASERRPGLGAHPGRGDVQPELPRRDRPEQVGVLRRDPKPAQLQESPVGRGPPGHQEGAAALAERPQRLGHPPGAVAVEARLHDPRRRVGPDREDGPREQSCLLG